MVAVVGCSGLLQHEGPDDRSLAAFSPPGLLDSSLMVVGVCNIQLRIEGSRSLKDRRRVVQRLKKRLRNRFNVSVSELDPDDSWNGATLGVAVVTASRPQADRTLREVLDHIEHLQPGVVHDFLMEFL